MTQNRIKNRWYQRNYSLIIKHLLLTKTKLNEDENCFCSLTTNSHVCMMPVCFKGPSIYDIHKKITFLTPPPPCPHASTWAGPPSPLWTSTHGRHEIHTALLKRLVQFSLSF